MVLSKDFQMLRCTRGAENELSPSSGGLLLGMGNGYVDVMIMQECGN